MTEIIELDQIKRCIKASELIDEIEHGFVQYSEGKVTVPPVGFLHFDKPPGDVHIKYGAINADDYYVLKVASAFYLNPDLNLPVNDGLILVFSQKTGQLEKILLDKGWLTDMRTAAAGAVVAKHLAPRNIDCIGIVGTGVQARLQLQLLREVVSCRQVLVWGRDRVKSTALVAELNRSPGYSGWSITVAENIDQLMAVCNLVVTTTSARAPLIDAEQVRAGTHITAIGSDDHGKQELHSSVVAAADVVVADSLAQCVDHGECAGGIRENAIVESSIIELGQVIRKPELGRVDNKQITVADLTGVAVQDIQIAKLVNRALINQA